MRRDLDQMPRLKIDDTDVRLVPELCAAAIREELSSEFYCWLIMRHVDIVENRGTGRIGLRAAIHYLHQMLGLTERRVRQIIDSGYGTFWRRGRGGWIYLVGVVPMCRLLSSGDLWSCYVMMPYPLFSVGSGYSKSILFAAVACTSPGPTAIARIADRCGVSERTVQRKLKDCGGLLFVRRNVMFLDDPDGCHAPVWKLLDKNGNLCFVRDIPNSYEASTGRQSYKRLRRRVRLAEGLQPGKRRGRESRGKLTERIGIGHLFTASGNQFADGQMVGSWRTISVEA